ncbi:hypothetical protein Pcinc_015908 [Petrolisthes cinctipes]|uniref:Methyltransferase type 11 domain-containing protein n=1 Tax=Petrolisthes cinctipes TaxID=88211 RepID=A0AAE1FS34_PETCI|nr:hypothetical protein Pcinc_015908 [Petrolisthes cinctipes]
MSRQVDLVFADSNLTNKYIQYRPVPPLTLCKAVVDHVKKSRGDDLGICGDIGCGSGQNTSLYSDYFREVVGVDVSPQQLAIARTATQHLTNVTFKEGSGERLPFADHSVDLLTCCVSVHWFDYAQFYSEVERVLKPGGVLACYSYLVTSIHYNDKVISDNFTENCSSIKPYWPASHNVLWEEYSTLPKLYEDDILIRKSEGRFITELDSTLDSVIGYISSWSAFAKLAKAKGNEAANAFLNNCKQHLLKEMGTDDESVPIKHSFNYFLRMWRKPASF